MKKKALVIIAFSSVEILKNIKENIRISSLENPELSFIFTDNPDKVFDTVGENILIFSDDKFFRTNLTGASFTEHLMKSNTVVAFIVNDKSVYSNDLNEFLLLVDMVVDELSTSSNDKPFEIIVKVTVDDYMQYCGESSLEVVDKNMSFLVSDCLVKK